MKTCSWQVVPDVRLIYLIRHPIERIRSMYAHLAVTGFERRPIDRAVLTDDDYVLTSSYFYQLKPYLDLFPRGRLLVVDSRDLLASRSATLSRVLRLLGVEPTIPADAVQAEPNRAADRRVDRRGLGATARLPGYRRLLDRSWRVRRVHRRITTRPSPTVPTELSPEVEVVLKARLAKDTALLRDALGPDFRGWNPPPASRAN